MNTQILDIEDALVRLSKTTEDAQRIQTTYQNLLAEIRKHSKNSLPMPADGEFTALDLMRLSEGLATLSEITKATLAEIQTYRNLFKDIQTKLNDDKDDVT